jgi:hypothetical protein
MAGSVPAIHVCHCEEPKATKQSPTLALCSRLLRCARNDLKETAHSCSSARTERADPVQITFVLWLARDTRSGARTNHLAGSKSRSCVDRIESGGIAAGRLI